jgi:hypothetical protein
MKKIRIKESDIRKVIRRYILENEGELEEKKPRCLTDNTIPLDEIVGMSDDYTDYTSNVKKRLNGIKGMVDSLDILRTLRLHPNIGDGGEHLSYELMNHLNKFRNKHYFDETNSDCHSAMDKVIELYKENEHGEELVKDIEKVLKHNDPTPRAKEYLKRCLMLIKEK